MDDVEQLCAERVGAAFKLDKTVWDVNFQYHSPEPANLQACSTILHSADRIIRLGLDKCHQIFKYCVGVPYPQSESFTSSDCNQLESVFRTFSPRVLFMYPCALRPKIDYEVLINLCHKTNPFAIINMTSTAGSMATENVFSPFGYADIVINGTQDSLRGPCDAMIFFRKTAMVKCVQNTHDDDQENVRRLKNAIDATVFPRHQGSLHNHVIMAMAVALKQVSTKAFKEYRNCVSANAVALREELQDLECQLRHKDGTQLHKLAVQPSRLDKSAASYILDRIGIGCNVASAENELHFGTQIMTT